MMESSITLFSFISPRSDMEVCRIQAISSDMPCEPKHRLPIKQSKVHKEGSKKFKLLGKLSPQCFGRLRKKSHQFMLTIDIF